MRFKLNKWQRGLLLLAAAGIATATLNQHIEYGFEGVSWIVPIVVAVAIAFVGISDLQPSQKKLEERPKEKSTLKPSDPQQMIAAMAKCAGEIYSLIPIKDTAQKRAPTIEMQGLVGVSSIATRATVYGFVVAHIAALRVDPEFDDLPSTKEFHKAYGDLFKKAWLRRWGKDVAEPPDGEATISMMLDMAKGMHLQTEVHNRMAERHAAPFQPLYKFVDGDSGASDKELEAKYGPTTRKLLLAILGRTK